MSRIGNNPILIPDNVQVNIEDNKVTVKGPKGEIPDIRKEVMAHGPKIFFWSNFAKSPVLVGF